VIVFRAEAREDSGKLDLPKLCSAQGSLSSLGLLLIFNGNSKEQKQQ